MNFSGNRTMANINIPVFLWRSGKVNIDRTLIKEVSGGILNILQARFFFLSSKCWLITLFTRGGIFPNSIVEFSENFFSFANCVIIHSAPLNLLTKCAPLIRVE